MGGFNHYMLKHCLLAHLQVSELLQAKGLPPLF